MYEENFEDLQLLIETFKFVALCSVNGFAILHENPLLIANIVSP